jgi:hypothetical protein
MWMVQAPPRSDETLVAAYPACRHLRVFETMRAAREAVQRSDTTRMPFRCPKCKAWILRGSAR